MMFLVITNGAYGDLDWYRSRIGKFKKKIVADGAARRARELEPGQDAEGDLLSVVERMGLRQVLAARALAFDQVRHGVHAETGQDHRACPAENGAGTGLQDGDLREVVLQDEAIVRLVRPRVHPVARQHLHHRGL